MQTTERFVRVTLTVVASHGPAEDIQYKPTQNLYCVLRGTDPDQGTAAVYR